MPLHDLQNIMNQIVVVQKEITTPTNQKPIQHFYDEPPGAVSTFPCFINVVESTEISNWPTSGRRADYIIAMHLLFAAASQKYSVRARSTWVRPVKDAFGKRLTLAGATGVVQAMLQGEDFEPVTFGQTEYIAVTFKLEVLVLEPFEWAIGAVA